MSYTKVLIVMAFLGLIFVNYTLLYILLLHTVDKLMTIYNCRGL